MALTYRGHKISEIKEEFESVLFKDLFKSYLERVKELFISPENYLLMNRQDDNKLFVSAFCYAVEMYEEGINLIPSAFEQAIKEVAEACKPDEKLKASFDNSIRNYYDTMPSFKITRNEDIPTFLNDVPDIDLMKDIISDQSYKVDAEIERMVRRVIRVFLGTEILDLESLKGQFELITTFEGHTTNLVHLETGKTLLTWFSSNVIKTGSYRIDINIIVNEDIFSHDKFGNLILKTDTNEQI